MEGPFNLGGRAAQLLLPPGPQGARVGRLHRAEAAVAPPGVRRAQSPAAGLGDRAQAGHPSGYHHAHVSLPLALDADAVGGQVGAAAVEIRAEHLQQLTLVDGAAPQLQVDGDVVGDGGGALQRADVLRGGVDGADELRHVLEVAQGLDTPCRGAGPDGDQKPRQSADLPDVFQVAGRRDAAFHQGDVVRPPHAGPGRLREVSDLHRTRHRQKLVFQVEQAQLAPVAGGELPDREGGLAPGRHAHISLFPKNARIRS